MIDGKIYPGFVETKDNGKYCKCAYLGKFGSGKCVDSPSALG